MRPTLFRLSLISLILSNTLYAKTTLQPTTSDKVIELDTVYATAEQQLQQSLGASIITSKDLEKHPVVNDISEIVRTMPGVNLSGNTASGQRGNKRQIDLRGMGPENTLILIDGKPVTSRNTARISMRGERNTTGDSNWVPPEAIESIEVIRGPAAARYGSGAMGGVVNITTKKITNEYSGYVNYFTNRPEDSDEGATNRVGFLFSGPIVKDKLAFRIYGNINKTDADSPTINSVVNSVNAAGLEGVRNKDIAARFDWKLNDNHSLTLDASFSRQGNIYNGDTQNSNAGGITSELLDNGVEETSRIYRESFSLTHDGHWGKIDTKTWLSYEHTTNSHMPEGTTGSIEGSYQSTNFIDSRLTDLTAHTEVYIPFNGWGNHVLTIGGEIIHSKLTDPDSFGIASSSLQAGVKSNAYLQDAVSPAESTSQTSWALFAEDNWEIKPGTTLIPTIRFDHDNRSGAAVSGGLNITQQLSDNWTIKGGIARAYKAPNLYQSTRNFTLSTRGNGCPIGLNNCIVLGNPDLKPEYSWNKEIGIEFQKNGYQTSLTYFHNHYTNKITASDYAFDDFTVKGNSASAAGGRGSGRNGAASATQYSLLEWVNTPSATIAGIEGNLVIPLHDTLKWSTNFTYMQKSEDYQGNPLSLIPKYTVNSTLSWVPNENWDANITYTQYGRIKPRSVATKNLETRYTQSLEVPSYGVVGASVGYTWKHGQVRIGVSNIFDKKLYRSNESGFNAQSFNQHGRAYYANLRFNF